MSWENARESANLLAERLRNFETRTGGYTHVGERRDGASAPPSEAIDSPRSEVRYSTRHDGREMLPGPARYGHDTDIADVVERRAHESQNFDASEHPFVPQVAAGGQTARDWAETWHDEPAAEPVYDQPAIGDEPHHPR
jgi:hypothetical protein